MRTLVPVSFAWPSQLSDDAMALPDAWVRKLRTSDVTKQTGSYRGEIRRMFCCFPAFGIPARIKRPMSKYKLAQKNTGATTTRELEVA